MIVINAMFLKKFIQNSLREFLLAYYIKTFKMQILHTPLQEGCHRKIEVL